MENPNKSPLPKSIISKAKIRHSNTYTSPIVQGVADKVKKRRVVFVDRVKNAPLITIFNYEQVEVVEDEASPKSTSCACIIS